MTEKDMKEKFDAFVKKYNDAVELFNSKCKIIYGDRGWVEKKLIKGTYSFNDDGTIDINGDFTMRKIDDLDVNTKTWKKDPVFVIDDFPFKINRVSGDFQIVSTHIKNLDMFPRLVEGRVYVASNYDLVSVKGVAGSIVKRECLIESKAQTLYFPDYVGRNLIVDSRCYKDFCADKTVCVGGRFIFMNIHPTDPIVPEIKATVKAKSYTFDKQILFFTISNGEKCLNCRIFENEDLIDGKPFFHVEPASVWVGGKWEICISLDGKFLKAVNTGERKSTNRFADIEKFIQEWLPKPCSNDPKVTNFVHVQIMWNRYNPDKEIKIKEWE